MTFLTSLLLLYLFCISLPPHSCIKDSLVFSLKSQLSPVIFLSVVPPTIVVPLYFPGFYSFSSFYTLAGDVVVGYRNVSLYLELTCSLLLEATT